MKACWSAARWCEASSVELEVAAARSKPIWAENQQTPADRNNSRLPVYRALALCSVSSARERADDKATPHHTSISCAIGSLRQTNILREDTPILISPRCAPLTWTLRAARKPQHFENTQVGTLHPEKENRCPRSMSAASLSQDAGKSMGRNTPGRRGRTGNQYFDVGKVGR